MRRSGKLLEEIGHLQGVRLSLKMGSDAHCYLRREPITKHPAPGYSDRLLDKLPVLCKGLSQLPVSQLPVYLAQSVIQV